MFKEFINNLPNYKFWLANLFFWLILNTIAASHSYRMSIHYERPGEWIDIWLQYLPWWGNWAIIAPLIIAASSFIRLKNKNYVSFVSKNLIIMLIIFFFYWGLTTLEVALISENEISLAEIKLAIGRLLLSPLHMDFIVYMAVLCAGYAFSYYQTAKIQFIQNEQLSKQLVQIELQALKSQLNPHFLFNTLNTISSLIRLDEKKSAIKALSELSIMLRRVLENNDNQLVTLSEEMEFINSYLTIQKMRFEDKLTTDIHIADDCLETKIPFMLLQPLVENAVQHGSQLESNNNILKLNVSRHGNRLKVILVNKIPETEASKGFGIGMKNCRERMSKLYQKDFSLDLIKLDKGYFQTYLSLPYGDYDD
ncbi:sensor histidine kinase [Colwelliaceae bacterium 6471]